MRRRVFVREAGRDAYSVDYVRGVVYRCFVWGDDLGLGVGAGPRVRVLPRFCPLVGRTGFVGCVLSCCCQKEEGGNVFVYVEGVIFCFGEAVLCVRVEYGGLVSVSMDPYQAVGADF